MKILRPFLVAPAALAIVVGLCAVAPAPAETKSDAVPTPAASVDPDAPAVEAFQARLKDYVALHRKLEAKLPKLSKESTPKEIDKNQRALATLIQAERRGAVRGEFFTPAVENILRRVFDKVFAGPDGKALLASIMDENPGIPKFAVNGRYPDAVPLSTMPPEVLSALPPLDEDMEYRFVGDRLILLDSHAHLIVDFTENLLPKRK